MTDRRMEVRAEKHARRAREKAESLRMSGAALTRLMRCVASARAIASHPSFMGVLRSQGVHTLPRLLVERQPPSAEFQGDLASTRERLEDMAIEFVIAWKFFFPLFANSIVAGHLDRNWPGFTLEMKDVFISLVLEGPFPHSESGHRGRRHNAHYFVEDRPA